jgi:hypothetical protein
LSRPPNRGTFSYRDEEALVRHLIGDLERKLSGRHETRILRIIPSDHCHLGVLGPRDPHVVQPEPLEPEVDTVPPTEEKGTRPKQDTSASPSVDSDEEEPAEVAATAAEQVTAEQQGTTRDSTRRPPSSLGFEVVIAPHEEIELTLQVRFAVYTQHFPTFEEERDELGRVVQDQADPNQPPQPRQTVSLLEVFERRKVEVPPITIRLDLKRKAERLTDDGAVQRALDAVLAEAASSPTIARAIQGNAVVPAQALTDADAFRNFLRGVAAGAATLPPLRASLDIRSSALPDGTVRVSCYICNNTPRNLTQRFRDQHNILADCELSGTIVRGSLMPVELLPVAKDYQFDRRVWAVGHSASIVVSDDKKALRTETLARFDQPRRTTNQNPRAVFSELASEPIETLETIRVAMIAYGDAWQKQILDDNSLDLTADESKQCESDLKAFRDEETRFAAGIAALGKDDRLMQAFRGMNRIFQRTSKFESWHLFQIVFIVSEITALVIREGISGGEWPTGSAHTWDDVLNWADVLWFPTGGGKTEAYLGLISCAALYDRLRGKSFGVTAWLRFPLRMLSVQQLQRAARVVWETEKERRTLKGDDPTSQPISLGYFVGKSSTPNRLNYAEWAFDRLESDPELRNRLLLVSNCPACDGTNTVQIVIDRALLRIRHVCSQCHEHLPIFVSDDEIYRFLPTVIVGTIDKMASIAFRPDFPMLWGATAWRCPEHPEHGFGMGDWCIQGCPTNPAAGRKGRKRTAVVPYDPSPALHIQDELHLLQQELGAFAGHYETLVRSCEEQVGTRPAKTIAATATIEGYEHQIRQIYGVPNARRFPTRGYSLLETFYTSPDFDGDSSEERIKTARVYVAFRPPHLHAADAASLCVRYLHEELNRLFANPYDAAAWLPTARTEEAVRDLLYFYSTTLTYVGSKSRGVRIRQALDRDAGRLRPGQTRDLNTEFLSGDSTLAAIADVVRRVEDPPAWTEDSHLDATVATSIISHGVDVERFNLMVMDSIPEETADYIQASSRSGRRHVGLILATLASYSLRASSIYHRFTEYHRHLERLVSPVSVNRFAKFAAQRTSSGVFAGVLLGRYGAIMHNQQLRERRVAAEFLNPNATSQLSRQVPRWEIEQAMREAYALDKNIYPEGLELRMRQVLGDQVDHFLHLIAGSRKKWLTEVLQPTPMTSLRDVDVGVRFRPDEDADYRDLQWFNTEGS